MTDLQSLIEETLIVKEMIGMVSIIQKIILNNIKPIQIEWVFFIYFFLYPNRFQSFYEAIRIEPHIHEKNDIKYLNYHDIYMSFLTFVYTAILLCT